MKLSTIIIILLVLLVAAGALAFYELRADLSIEIDDHEQNVTVWAWTVGEALAEAGVPVWQEDKVIPAVDERALLNMGVDKVFRGSLVKEVVDYLNKHFGQPAMQPSRTESR